MNYVQSNFITEITVVDKKIKMSNDYDVVTIKFYYASVKCDDNENMKYLTLTEPCFVNENDIFQDY